ncbi:MAG: hypothetical protein AAF961_03040 [Planctomycetota bacterium]
MESVDMLQALSHFRATVAAGRTLAASSVLLLGVVTAPCCLGQDDSPAPSGANAPTNVVESSPSLLTGLQNVLLVVAIFVVPLVVGNWLAKRLRMPDYGWKFALAIGTVAAAALVVSTGEIKLGPDLSGGITLIYELADASVAEDGQPSSENSDDDADDTALKGDALVQALIKALTERVDPSGTKEVSIRKYGDGQIEIIIPKA